ncbi:MULTISPECIES: MFS transporter [unclassified Sphingomonas]|uniref:MFS transporter n=1 Tax=unclassified Sphingomonas TaxID=196159 RepID=UPI0006FBD45D|nr:MULTISPECIES: MFS transporter [unclassified Sphingomonas]KQX25118.1 MFS transporter [Sphingomonas sp. Root1294]KQY66135.1 MFS transporter [Sphingomonas sp. Root50]KRB89699.1 MFS transporter [Sphingomonas sp. Root720]
MAGDTIGAEQDRAPARTGPLLPMIIGAALFMHTLDSNVIAIALPTMARSLHTDPVKLNVAITAYLLAAAVFLPLSTWVADRFGAKNVFRVAIAAFAASSLMCGVAQDFWQLVGARMLQGASGAMMLPVGRLVLLRSVRKSELVQAMSYLTIPAVIGPIVGPPLGGFLVTHTSWRWIFLINVPIAAIGILLATLFIPAVREEKVDRLDLRGLVLSAAALSGLVFGFESLGNDTLPWPLVVAILLGGAGCGYLYLRHARRTPGAIIDLSLLRIQTFRASAVGGLFSRLILGAIPFLLALMLQLGFGMSAFEVGLLTFNTALGAIVVKASAPAIIRALGFRNVLIGNAVLLAAVSAGYALFGAATPHWIMIGALFFGGFLRSLQFTTLNSIAYADVPPARMSHASSLSSMFQQLAQSLGVGFAAAIIDLQRDWHGRAMPAAADIGIAFPIIAAVSLAGLISFLRLPPDAGAEVSGRR